MNYLKEKRKNEPLAYELNLLLANYSIYRQNLKNFHWNIVGFNFFELHERFEEMYLDADKKINEIAKRILILKFQPLGNFSQYSKIACIKETETDLQDYEMVQTILQDQEILLKQLETTLNKAREVKKFGISEALADFVYDIEQQNWHLSAWNKQNVEQQSSIY